MNILQITVGLPRSGKSTWAKQQTYPIVNPDSIRLALHGRQFLPDAEPMVWAIAKYMVKSLFLAGHTKVILDATNTTEVRRAAWKSSFWVREFIELNTSTEVCLERAGDDEGLKQVISNMSNYFESLTDAERNELTQAQSKVTCSA